MPGIELREALDPAGRSPFVRWFARLDAPAAARVTTALYRLADGNVSKVKSVGAGIGELRIDFGPGLRVYFGRVGSQLVILLGGGSKTGQAADIERAKALWAWHRRSRRERRDEER